MAAARHHRRLLGVAPLTGRQVNLLLEGLIAASFLTGLGSWMVPTALARPLTLTHAITGITLLLLAPTKVAGPVRTGLRRRRVSRWLSIALGVIIVASVALGTAHATGLWFGVGEWSALWTHLLLAFAAVPLVVWHRLARPVRPRPSDLDRRALLRTAMTLTAAAGVVGTQELAVRALGLDGARRSATGSHAIATLDPDRLPVVSWLDDTAPDLDPDDWPLRIAGRPVAIPDLVALAVPLDAEIDCTGGWRSLQRWDVVAVSTVLPDGLGRSIRVTSATGYTRLFDPADVSRIHLAVGYGGRALRRGHGAPVRLVVPGRRGPWWVKWVTEIDYSNRPAWTQLPFPPT